MGDSEISCVFLHELHCVLSEKTSKNTVKASLKV